MRQQSFLLCKKEIISIIYKKMIIYRIDIVFTQKNAIFNKKENILVNKNSFRDTLFYKKRRYI